MVNSLVCSSLLDFLLSFSQYKMDMSNIGKIARFFSFLFFLGGKKMLKEDKIKWIGESLVHFGVVLASAAECLVCQNMTDAYYV